MEPGRDPAYRLQEDRIGPLRTPRAGVLMTVATSILQRIAPDVTLGRDVKIYDFVNLYGCRIGDETRIGTFVEIQRNATIGARCKISSHTFICEGITIEDDCFIGHHVCF